jgi:hypothetical protein
MAKQSNPPRKAETAGTGAAAAPARAKKIAQENPPEPVVEQEEIAKLAYQYWEARGCTGGSPEEDWLRAEQELKARRSAVKE